MKENNKKMEEQFKKIFRKEDESNLKEKHVPVVEIEEGDKETKINVKAGSAEHPSEPAHFVQWIEIFDGEISLEKVYLSPLSKPKASFFVKEMPKNLKARIFCNLHGTWESEK